MTKPLRADAQRNRNCLIDAARKVFDAGQFDLRFDDFARLACVGVGTLYRHFPTREALAEAVYHEEITALCDRASQLQMNLSAREVLVTFLRDVVAHMDAHPGFARTLVTLLSTRPEVPVEGTRLLERTIGSLISNALEEGVGRNEVYPDTIMLVLQGIGAARAQPNWQAVADNLLTLLMDGLYRP